MLAPEQVGCRGAVLVEGVEEARPSLPVEAAVIPDRFDRPVPGGLQFGPTGPSEEGPEQSFDPLLALVRFLTGRDRPLAPLTVGALARFMWEEPSRRC